MVYKNEIDGGIVKLSNSGSIGFMKIDTGKKNLITNPQFVNISLLNKWIADCQLKALIITGNKRHFSYGADVDNMNLITDGWDKFEKAMNHGKEILAIIEQLPLVTVAAINGGCFGAGFEIALSCHFRICGSNAFMGLPEVNRGLIPGLCGVERLTKIVGESKSIELALLGTMITAEEAKKLNIVSKVSEGSDCLSDAFEFTCSLINERTSAQIKSVLSSAKNYQEVLPNNKNRFVEILKYKNSME